MNYHRGFRRLFVVLTLCWYVAAVPILWPRWSKAINAQGLAQAALASAIMEEAKTKDRHWLVSPERFLAEAAVQEAKDERPILATVTFVLIPGAIYVLSIAVLWVASGFRGGTQI